MEIPLADATTSRSILHICHASECSRISPDAMGLAGSSNPNEATQ